MQQVFISYRRVDVDYARRLREKLITFQYEVWMDIYSIPKGAYWRSEIDQGLANSQAVIGIITPEALESRNVLNEWYWALDHHRRFIPIRLREVEMMPHSLSALNYIDCTANWDQGVAMVLDMLRDPDAHSVYRDNIVITSRAGTPTHHHTNRDMLLDKVQTFWVDGILEKALHGNRAIDLSLQGKGDAVLKHQNYEDYLLPTSKPILEVFEDMQRELLILGVPGAGKTFTLLQLARDLIIQARSDPRRPMPVVFNLSSWAGHGGNLADWLINELRLQYQTPRRVATTWVENGNILPLLDGLDEVDPAMRDACVLAINEFRQDFKFVDMAVCSRIADYESLVNRLQLEGAIVLNPLSPDQINDYLHAENLAGVRDLLTVNTTVQQMVSIPFLLNTIAYTYQNMTGSALQLPISDDPVAARHAHLFDHYLEKRFHEHPSEVYTLRQFQHYLTWLAQQMIAHSDTVFLIERLNIQWLSDRRAQQWFRRGMPLLLGFLLGVLPLWMTQFTVLLKQTVTDYDSRIWTNEYTHLANAFLFGLVYPLSYLAGFFLSYRVTGSWKGKLGALLLLLFILNLLINILNIVDGSAVPVLAYAILAAWAGIIHAFVFVTAYQLVHRSPPQTDGVRLIERLRWSHRRALRGAGEGLAISLWLVLISVVTIALLYGGDYLGKPSRQHMVLQTSLLIMIAGIPTFTLLRGLSSAQISMKIYPNQGMRQSAQNALFIAFVASVVGVLIYLSGAFALGATGMGNPSDGLFNLQLGLQNARNNLTAGPLVFFACLTMMLLVMLFGGLTLLQHALLRFFLWRNGEIPLNYAAFLDYAAERMLLRKVGGGYIFIHKYLLEYLGKPEN